MSIKYKLVFFIFIILAVFTANIWYFHIVSPTLEVELSTAALNGGSPEWIAQQAYHKEVISYGIPILESMVLASIGAAMFKKEIINVKNKLN